MIENVVKSGTRIVNTPVITLVPSKQISQVPLEINAPSDDDVEAIVQTKIQQQPSLINQLLDSTDLLNNMMTALGTNKPSPNVINNTLLNPLQTPVQPKDVTQPLNIEIMPNEPDFSWKVGDWSECQDGKRSRNVWCEHFTGKKVDTTECSSERPASVEDCEMPLMNANVAIVTMPASVESETVPTTVINELNKAQEIIKDVEDTVDVSQEQNKAFEQAEEEVKEIQNQIASPSTTSSGWSLRSLTAAAGKLVADTAKKAATTVKNKVQQEANKVIEKAKDQITDSLANGMYNIVEKVTATTETVEQTESDSISSQVTTSVTFEAATADNSIPVIMNQAETLEQKQVERELLLREGKGGVFVEIKTKKTCEENYGGEWVVDPQDKKKGKCYQKLAQAQAEVEAEAQVAAQAEIAAAEAQQIAMMEEQQQPSPVRRLQLTAKNEPIKTKQTCDKYQGVWDVNDKKCYAQETAAADQEVVLQVPQVQPSPVRRLKLTAKNEPIKTKQTCDKYQGVWDMNDKKCYAQEQSFIEPEPEEEKYPSSSPQVIESQAPVIERYRYTGGVVPKSWVLTKRKMAECTPDTEFAWGKTKGASSNKCYAIPENYGQ